jgi:hypothetical protein
MLALVIGGAKGVIYDLGVFHSMGHKPDAVVVCNDIGALSNSFDHWVTLHPENWSIYITQRRLRGLSETSAQLWSPKYSFFAYVAPGELNILPDWEPSGLTGLYAVKVAKKIGAGKIVLAGVPMDRTGHILPSGLHWINERRRESWLLRRAELTDVRSMSGWTRQVFGYPTQEWLCSKL